MTREEAIEHLSVLAERMDTKDADVCVADIPLKCVDMAIEALEQEPCEDAISRDVVVYYIKGHIHEIITESGEDKNAHTNRVLRALINGVETMPTVTPKPKESEEEQ